MQRTVRPVSNGIGFFGKGAPHVNKKDKEYRVVLLLYSLSLFTLLFNPF